MILSRELPDGQDDSGEFAATIEGDQKHFRESINIRCFTQNQKFVQNQKLWFLIRLSKGHFQVNHFQLNALEIGGFFTVQ